MGTFLNLLSVDKSPDPPLQWTSTPSPEGESKLYSTLSMVMRAQQAVQDQVQCSNYTNYSKCISELARYKSRPLLLHVMHVIKSLFTE